MKKLFFAMLTTLAVFTCQAQILRPSTNMIAVLNGPTNGQALPLLDAVVKGDTATVCTLLGVRLHGPGTPSDSQGSAGSTWVNDDTGDIYWKTTAGWQLLNSPSTGPLNPALGGYGPLSITQSTVTNGTLYFTYYVTNRANSGSNLVGVMTSTLGNIASPNYNLLPGAYLAKLLTLTSPTAGTLNGTVYFTDNGGNGQATFSGTFTNGVAAPTPPVLNLVENSYDFGTSLTNPTPLLHTFQLLNTGGSLLTYSATISGANFSIASGASGTIVAGGSANLGVNMALSSAATNTGYVSITSDAGNASITLAGASTNAPVVTPPATGDSLTNGLIAAYPFSSLPWNGLVGTEAALNDAVPTQPTFATYATNQFSWGNGAYFPYTSGYGYAGLTNLLSPGLAGSISCWVRMEVLNTTGVGQFVYRGGPNLPNEVCLGYSPGGGFFLRAYTSNGSSSSGVTNSVTALANTVYHVVCTWDYNNASKPYTIMVNGVDATGTVGVAMSTSHSAGFNQFYVSASKGATDGKNSLKGAMAHLYVWNRALDNTEKTKLYNNGSGWLKGRDF